MIRCGTPGCGTTSNTENGIGVHRKSCLLRIKAIENAFQKRALEDAEEEDERARKRVYRGEDQDIQGNVEEAVRAPSPPPPRASRFGRRLRIPTKLVDQVPTDVNELPAHLKDAFVEPAIPPGSPQRYRSPTVEDAEDEDDRRDPKVFRTPLDAFGLYREYTVAPQEDPEAHISLSSRCDAPTLAQDPKPTDAQEGSRSGVSWLSGNNSKAPDGDDHPVDSETASKPIGPFDNPSQFRIYDWHYNSSLTKSKDDLDDILDVLRSPGFSVDDLKGFHADTGQVNIDKYYHPKGIFSQKDGWVEGSVDLPLPKTGIKYPSEDAIPTFRVGGIYHRKLAPLLRSAAEDLRFGNQYHWIPNRLFWTPRAPGSAPNGIPAKPLRVFTDGFNSNAMLRDFEELRAHPRNPADAPSVEYGIFSIRLWSDALHLTSFGSASLWPIYLYLGNLSKYIRGMPTEFAAHHLAYIPSLPDELSDHYKELHGTAPSADMLTFLKRELMQRIWLLLLDKEFMDIYENGMVVTCGDGVVRRIFPRFSSYSADYPEKILLTALKPLSNHPCPRCLIHHDDLCEAGTPEDAERRAEKRVDSEDLRKTILRARKLVLEKGRSLKSKKVQALLEPQSLNPIQSAFSVRLADFGVNAYDLFVPDLLHEFELGVWKGTFNHLMRLLAAQGNDAVQEFNRRMRNMPTFGRDTIRKFWKDVSARKQLAARDYEDFLIVMIPAFEGLLPLRDNQTTADLLFELANWHGLAKLRMHTEITLSIFRASTTYMTEAVRHFAATTCENWETHELPREVDARVRRKEKRGHVVAPEARERKSVRYNTPHTFKFHVLPDYPDSIEETGPTDNGSTQVGELEHRHAKRFYIRTNKIGPHARPARAG
ncbi:hypothetical protein VTO73DRAFT_3264 [Trametes versicolor]